MSFHSNFAFEAALRDRLRERMFDLQPKLSGQVVKLRPLEPGDFQALYAVASDPLIWEQHPVHDRYKEGVFKEFFRDALESRGALVAVDLSTGSIIGSSRFNAYAQERSEIEIGYTFLARSHWGGVYNLDMKRLMVGHAFQFVDRVFFLVGPSNLRSQRALEKIGGLRAGLTTDGVRGERVVYEIRKGIRI